MHLNKHQTNVRQAVIVHTFHALIVVQPMGVHQNQHYIQVCSKIPSNTK